MYKIIACDLDETLLNSNHVVSKRNKELIEKAKALGVKFVPATGRGFTSVTPTLDSLNLLNEENEYVISFNGGAITENKSNRLLHFEGISFEKALELFNIGLTYDVGIRIYTIDKVYAYNLNEEELTYSKARMKLELLDSPNIDFLKNEELVKVLYSNTNYDYLKSIENNLQNHLNNMNVTYSSNRYIEFNHSNVDKGSGLKTLAVLSGVDLKDTIAIGDNYNDLSMIKVAGIGVAVNNAVDDLKTQADYITHATNNEDAVAEVIEKFILQDY